jgi:uncharacterized protein YlaI
MARFIDLPNQKLRSGQFCPECGADALHYLTECEGKDADGKTVTFNLRRSPVPHYLCAACEAHVVTSMHCGHHVCQDGRYGRCISREMSH